MPEHQSQPRQDTALDGGSSPQRFNSALIVEDHPLFCDALAMTLRATIGIGSIATAASLEDAMDFLALGPVPDVIVLDLHLPDVQGLDGLVRLRNATDAPILAHGVKGVIVDVPLAMFRNKSSGACVDGRADDAIIGH